MQGGGISLSEVDNVINAFEEYKNDIQSFLEQAAGNFSYNKAYKGFEQAVQTYIEQISETVKTGIVARIDATMEALKNAKEEYKAKIEDIDVSVRKEGSRFTFDGK